MASLKMLLVTRTFKMVLQVRRRKRFIERLLNVEQADSEVRSQLRRCVWRRQRWRSLCPPASIQGAIEVETGWMSGSNREKLKKWMEKNEKGLTHEATEAQSDE